jgi:hypothetical protein
LIRPVFAETSADAVSVYDTYLAVSRSAVTYKVFFIDLVAPAWICNQVITIISLPDTTILPPLIALVHALAKSGFYLLRHWLLADPVEGIAVSISSTGFSNIDGRS